MKKAFSILLAVIFAISLMPIALADSTATITAYNSSDAQVGTTYATIDAAAAAAGQGGKVCISAGVLEVNGRQTISVSGVTLEGAGRGVTTIKPSANFANASETNRKAILTIAADNVTVKDLSLDGTDYGETIDMADENEYDFVVLRINSGSGIVLDDIYVAGSPKTLIQAGSGSNSVTVTADELYCDGMPKTINDGNAYPDIDVINLSSLTINSGAINGFIANELFASYTIGSGCEPMYTLRHSLFIRVTSTFQHFANTYAALRDEINGLGMDYTADFANSQNADTVSSMVDYAESIAATDPEPVENFIILLSDAAAQATSQASTLNGYIDRLEAALGTQIT